MILFMAITCITEMIGVYLKTRNHADPLHAHHNEWLYNILLVFQVGFISLMFRNLFNTYVKSDPVIFGGIAFLALLYICDLIRHGVFNYNNLTNTVASILFVMYSLYYYYLLLKDNAYEKLHNSASFWWVAGMLFFYFGRTACNIYFSQAPLIKLPPNQQHNLAHSIYIVLNIILYTCWSYSFICKKWAMKRPGH
jgi:hypothetical protein